MSPPKFHRRVMWCLWLSVFGVGMVIFALYSNAQEGEKRWGAEDWSLIMQFYFPHDHKHGLWFNRYGKNCCSGTDCFPARSGTVKWTPEGYRVVMPDGGYALMPEEKIKPNPDDVTDLRPTICMIKNPTVHKNYAGSKYVNTKWRVRSGCAWHGKPRL